MGPTKTHYHSWTQRNKVREWWPELTKEIGEKMSSDLEGEELIFPGT